MTTQFHCAREIDLPAGASEVWRAVATTEGLAAWLFPMPIPALGEGVTTWEPPHHLAIRMERGEWFNELDYTIDEHHGASTLRYVHRGVFVDNTDTQEAGIQQHTDFYLHTLSQSLEFFTGRRATFVGEVPNGIQGPASSAGPDRFDRLKAALGLDPDGRAGDPVRLTPRGVDVLDGVVDYLTANFLGVRTSTALWRFFGRNAFGQPVGMAIHLFDDGDPDAMSTRWQSWLDEAVG